MDGASFTLHGDVGALTVSAVECDGPGALFAAGGAPSRTVCSRVRFLPDGAGRARAACKRTWMISGFDGQEAPLEGYPRDAVTAAGSGPLREVRTDSTGGTSQREASSLAACLHHWLLVSLNLPTPRAVACR